MAVAAVGAAVVWIAVVGVAAIVTVGATAATIGKSTGPTVEAYTLNKRAREYWPVFVLAAIQTRTKILCTSGVLCYAL